MKQGKQEFKARLGLQEWESKARQDLRVLKEHKVDKEKLGR